MAAPSGESICMTMLYVETSFNQSIEASFSKDTNDLRGEVIRTCHNHPPTHTSGHAGEDTCIKSPMLTICTRYAAFDCYNFEPIAVTLYCNVIQCTNLIKSE